jgi:hypothetical protein
MVFADDMRQRKFGTSRILSYKGRIKVEFKFFPLYYFTFLKYKERYINPLNAELNPMRHLLILLGNLTFMGKCIVSISNKMQRYTVYLYLETVLHVSGGTSTHHQ